MHIFTSRRYMYVYIYISYVTYMSYIYLDIDIFLP